QPPCQGATTPVTGDSPLRVPCSRPPCGCPVVGPLTGAVLPTAATPVGWAQLAVPVSAAPACYCPCGLALVYPALVKRERGVFCCYFRLTCSSPNPILSGFPSLRHMASLDTDVDMVPAEEDSSVAQAPSSSSVPASSSSKKPKRFDIKKWNAVSLWAWGTCLTRTPS
ncbi:hypothetical protein BHE74_00019270, partial [Ensete ventricosum]